VFLIQSVEKELSDSNVERTPSSLQSYMNRLLDIATDFYFASCLLTYDQRASQEYQYVASILCICKLFQPLRIVVDIGVTPNPTKIFEVLCSWRVRSDALSYKTLLDSCVVDMDVKSDTLFTLTKRTGSLNVKSRPIKDKVVVGYGGYEFVFTPPFSRTVERQLSVLKEYLDKFKTIDPMPFYQIGQSVDTTHVKGNSKRARHACVHNILVKMYRNSRSPKYSSWLSCRRLEGNDSVCDFPRSPLRDPRNYNSEGM